MVRDDRHDGARERDKTSAELERELDATRARLDEHARRLQERLSPGQLLDQAIERARASGARDFLVNLGHSARDNPMPVALTGIAIAWLAAATSGATDAAAEETERARDRLRGGARAVRSSNESTRESVGDAAERAGDTLRGAGRELARGGARMGRSAARGGRRLKRGFGRALEEQPLLLGLVGLAAGAALGFALPATEREDEWLGEASGEWKERAARTGREGVQAMRRTVGGSDERKGNSSEEPQSAPPPPAPPIPSWGAGPRTEPRP